MTRDRIFAHLVFRTGADSVARRCNRHTAEEEATRENEFEFGAYASRDLPERSHMVAAAGVAVGSHNRLVVEEARNCEVYSCVNIGTKDAGASNPTGSSLAGVNTAVVVDLHILLRGIQIQDNQTFLLADVIERSKKDRAGDGLMLARRRKALPNGTGEARCEACCESWNCLIQLWS